MKYDIAIIGGGPAGYTAGERAGAAGQKVILFEKDALGGVCLNEGCIPTKTLLHSAKIYDSLSEIARYGVNVENGTFDLGKIIGRKQRAVRRLTAGVRQKLTAHNVEVVLSTARITGENSEKNIEIESGDAKYTAKHVIICAGSETFVPPIKGLEDRDFWTSREALENKDVPKSLAIIGGGVIGVEFASFFCSLGVKVTVIEMLPEILGNMDKQLSKMLRDELTKKGIEFHLETKVVEVTQNQVLIEKDGVQAAIDADKLLLSTGRVPSVKNLGVESLNLEMYGRGLKVDKHMRTSNSRVFACGDVTGQSLLAHTAIREAEVAVNTILEVKDEMSYKAIPGVIYTSPEVAGVGKTEDELNATGVKYTVHQLAMAFSGRFMVENETSGGICKLISDEKNIVIGCHILGSPASEIIVIAGIAVEKGFTVDEFKKIVFPHPTVGEILHDVLHS